MSLFILKRKRHPLERLIVSRHNLGAVAPFLHIRKRRAVQGLIKQILQQSRSNCKQRIIEIHNATAAAPIVFEGLFAKLLLRKIVADLFIQQFPVGVTEPVDTLFYVAHNQVVAVVRKAFR